jgi:hypothetical protein
MPAQSSLDYPEMVSVALLRSIAVGNADTLEEGALQPQSQLVEGDVEEGSRGTLTKPKSQSRSITDRGSSSLSITLVSDPSSSGLDVSEGTLHETIESMADCIQCRLRRSCTGDDHHGLPARRDLRAPKRRKVSSVMHMDPGGA